MPIFDLNKEVVTTEPVVKVEVPTNPLAKGFHIFQLKVVDDDGLESDPVEVRVVVRDDQKPTAILHAPTQVQLGQAFDLDGRDSSDQAPGRIVKYIWTLLR